MCLCVCVCVCVCVCACAYACACACVRLCACVFGWVDVCSCVLCMCVGPTYMSIHPSHLRPLLLFHFTVPLIVSSLIFPSRHVAKALQVVFRH